MPVGSLHNLIHRLRGADETAGGVDDAQLLRRFTESRDEAAFEVLVWRHGAMVLGVCQRLLGRTADADDAFQATFLTLVRKARTVRNPGALAGWLYRVAYRVGLNHRAARARRRARDLSAAPEPQVVDAPPAEDLRDLLDEEVNRLPEKFRRVVVLCYLEGRSTEEAAGALGCPKGTVLSRLASARERLRGRLLRRGVAPAVTLAVLAAAARAAPPPAALVGQALRGATAFAAGNFQAISPAALALARGVLRAMFLTKVKIAAAVVLLVGATGAGAAWLGHRPAENADPSPQAEVNPAEEGPVAAAEPSKADPPPRPPADPSPEPNLPKVQIRGGTAGPDNLDQAVQWLRGNQLQQLLAIGSLAKADVHAPRQAEIARELEKLLNGNDRLVALQSTKALAVWATKEQVP